VISLFATSERKKISLSTIALIPILLFPLLAVNSGTNQTSYIKAQNIILPSGVHSLSYSPNGSLLAVSYGRYYDYYGIQNKDNPPHWDGGVAIISSKSWETVKILKGHSGDIWAFWSPQGDILATVSLDKTVIFWNASSLEILRRITIPQVHDYGPQDQIAFAWSPNGEKFAVSICDEAIWVYSFLDQTLLNKLTAGPKSILTLAWSPGGRYLACGGWTDTVSIWDMKSFTLVKELDVVASRAITWSPDGKFLATGGEQISWASDIGPKNQIGKLIIWNTENWTPTFSQNLFFVRCLSWSSDGTKLAVARCERTFLIYNTNTWNIANQTLDTYGVTVIQWNPNSKELATGMIDIKGMISIWQESAQKQNIT
jgi:WD40 repeat protein